MVRATSVHIMAGPPRPPTTALPEPPRPSPSTGRSDVDCSSRKAWQPLPEAPPVRQHRGTGASPPHRDRPPPHPRVGPRSRPPPRHPPDHSADVLSNVEEAPQHDLLGSPHIERSPQEPDPIRRDPSASWGRIHHAHALAAALLRPRPREGVPRHPRPPRPRPVISISTRLCLRRTAQNQESRVASQNPQTRSQCSSRSLVP